MNNNIEDDEIDFGKIAINVKKYMKMILFITFMSTLIAGVYAYYASSLYSSSVTLSFSDHKMSKLASIIPEGFSRLANQKSELESIKLTIKTRKFINSVIKDLDLKERYFIQKKIDFIPQKFQFIEKKLKKEEVYGFKNLKIDLNIKDNRLNDINFEIKPFDDRHYILQIDEIQYKEAHSYNERIQTKAFSIKVIKRGTPIANRYFIMSTKKAQLVDNILEHLTITILADNVLKITYNNPLPRKAKELVSAIANKFILYTLKKKTDEISQTLLFLNTQINEIKMNLENEGDTLKKYQQKSNAFMPLESSRLIMKDITLKEEKLKILTSQLIEIQHFKVSLKDNRFNTIALLNSGIDIQSIQSLIDFFREESIKLNEMNLQSQNIEKAISSNSQLIQLINELNKKKKLLVDLEFNFTLGHPQVIETQMGIERLKGEIDSYIQTDIKKLMLNKKLTKNKIVNNIKITEKSLQTNIALLQKDIKNKRLSLQSLPEKTLTTQELKHKFELSENLYTFLLEKKMEFEITKASTIVNTQIIENARETLLPIKPHHRLVIIIIGFILGVISGLFLTWLRIILDTKIRDSSTIESLTNIPLYGILPQKKQKRFFQESLRSIRTNLHFVLPNNKGCVTIMLSSMIASEGKTTVVTGLAEIISKTNKKVLLIDLDLRKPRLYEELKQSNKEGISNYLVESKNINSFIQPIHDNLDFIAAGVVPPNPSELLMSDRFNELMNSLKKEDYNYIIFDTAPIGSVIDASLILQHTDILLFVLKANYSEKKYLEHFHKLSKEKKIKKLGIILNQVKLKKEHQYEYGYGYGY